MSEGISVTSNATAAAKYEDGCHPYEAPRIKSIRLGTNAQEWLRGPKGTRKVFIGYHFKFIPK